MADALPSVLIVADDRDLAGRLAALVLRLGYRQTSVLPLTGSERALVEGTVGSAGLTILALSSASDRAIGIARSIASQSPARALVAALALSGDEAARAAAALTPLLPVVDVSEEPALAVAMRGALQASRATAADRRRVWELQIVNEIAEVIARSLELEDVLTGALGKLLPALDAAGGSIRLLNEVTGEYETKAEVGPADVAAVFQGIAGSTERVIATRCPSVIDDLAADAPAELEAPLPVRSTISVPMLVKDELVGTLSVAAADPYRFERDDEHLLRIIAGQIGVAVQNARLHDVVRRASRSGKTRSTRSAMPIAVFDSRGGCCGATAALGAASRASGHGAAGARPATRSGSAADRSRGARSARRAMHGACRALRGHAPDGRDLQRHDVPGRRRERRAVGRAGREERDRGNPVARGGCGR